ncbi:MAG: hypothetical protein L0L95_13835, partial [Staphylococcus equorum]|nr:hypothetical protein [Staphylococcus equorum]
MKTVGNFLLKNHSLLNLGVENNRLHKLISDGKRIMKILSFKVRIHIGLETMMDLRQYLGHIFRE